VFAQPRQQLHEGLRDGGGIYNDGSTTLMASW